MNIREAIQKDKVATGVLFAMLAASGLCFCPPMKGISEVILAAGVVWAVWTFQNLYACNQDHEVRNFWLKETISNCFYMSLAVTFVLLCTPIGRKMGPDVQDWISYTVPLSHYTAPYILPAVLVTIFLVIVLGAEKLSFTASNSSEA